MKKLITIAMTLMLAVTIGCLEPKGGGEKSFDTPKPTVNTPTNPNDYTPENPEYRADVMVPPPYEDYNKNFQTDTMMCWAVATCDALANTGYATNADWCMYEMIDRFDDQPGQVVDAIRYWFALTGYNYIPAYQQTDPNYQIDFIVNQVDLGRPVMISMGNTHADIGHAITVYGYEHLANGEADGFMYILKVVDGDDHYSGVVEWGFYWNDSTGRWECYDRDFYLRGAYSLVRPEGVARNTTTTYDELTEVDFLVQ